MEFGFGVPNRGPLAGTDNMVALARGGEEMGFDIISVSDHIVVPRDINSRYPYSATGEFHQGAKGDYMEQLAVLSFIAAETSKARLLTAVMVLPHRPPVLTAKMLATIDVLSNGRLIVGCGVGWMQEEFDAIGAPPYSERGAVGDEYISAFKELWTNDNPSFQGKYCSFSNITFLPKPIQKPHPPIWIGGESPAALRRVGRLGDAWFPIPTNPRFPVGTPQEFSEHVSRIHQYALEAGRNPSEIDLAYRAPWYGAGNIQTNPNGTRRIFSGSVEQIASDINTFKSLGVRHLSFDFYGATVDETLVHMEDFVTQVKPLV